MEKMHKITENTEVVVLMIKHSYTFNPDEFYRAHAYWSL